MVEQPLSIFVQTKSGSTLKHYFPNPMEVRNGQCFYCTQWFDGIAFIVIERFTGPQLRHLHGDAATALLSTDKSPLYEFWSSWPFKRWSL